MCTLAEDTVRFCLATVFPYTRRNVGRIVVNFAFRYVLDAVCFFFFFIIYTFFGFLFLTIRRTGACFLRLFPVKNRPGVACSLFTYQFVVVVLESPSICGQTLCLLRRARGV